jgi:hypothetical protein
VELPRPTHKSTTAGRLCRRRHTSYLASARVNGRYRTRVPIASGVPGFHRRYPVLTGVDRRQSVLAGLDEVPPEDEASGSNPLGRIPLNRTRTVTYGAGLSLSCAQHVW